MINATPPPDPHPDAPTPKSHVQSEFVILTRTMLADELFCSLRTIDHLQAKGMPCIRIGRSRRYILSEVIAWLKRKGGR